MVLLITSTVPGRRRAGWRFGGTLAFPVNQFTRPELESILADPALIVTVGEVITEEGLKVFLRTREEQCASLREAGETLERLVVMSCVPDRRRAGLVFTGARTFDLDELSAEQMIAIHGDRLLCMAQGAVLTPAKLDVFVEAFDLDEPQVRDPEQDERLRAHYAEVVKVHMHPHPEWDDGPKFDWAVPDVAAWIAGQAPVRRNKRAKG